MATRTPRPRHYLMCPPTYFDVRYSINPWMNPARPVDAHRAMAQWQWLMEAFLDLGHKVDLIDPVPGLPDMVFAANAGTVVNGRVLLARYRYPQRAAEAPAYCEWFKTHGYPQATFATMVNEGEGDHLVTAGRILCGRGFRTDPDAHGEMARYFDRPVVPLDLVDPRFYHLDTALAVLDDESDEIMYYPGAFSRDSRAVLARLYPDAILAGEQDAVTLGLNAVSDGRNVLLPAAAANLAAALRERGFHPLGLDLSELLKSGGGVKCCTLEIREA
jgi:N-dimethylarginine dimethylaminohydrolase